MQNYRFFDRPGYFKALAARIAKAEAGERVYVVTMDFDPNDPLVAELLSTMGEAAKRGADVTFLADAHNFLADERGIPGPLFYGLNSSAFRDVHAQKLRALQTLESSGGKFCITNLPKQRFNPPAVGRSHIKAAVVGDTMYVGGCNLEHTSHIDVMVAWKNAAASDELATWLQKIYESGVVRAALHDVDAETSVTSTTSLVIDAGVRGQSLIYDEALQLIDEAQAWLFMTCQYLPSGRIAKHLAAAEKRGVKVDVYYSHPLAHGARAYMQYVHQATQRVHQLPASLRRGQLDRALPKLHAKVLISEKEALIGSHNYVEYGVRFGTAELALRSTDKEFGKQLRAFIQAQLARLR